MKKLLFCLFLMGCSAITPDDRAKAYSLYAKDFNVKCRAYRFDRSVGLTPEVPEMKEACK